MAVTTMKVKALPPAIQTDLLGHVALDRLFAPIDKDAEIPLDPPPYWGRKYGNWLSWAELIDKPRVVLLAEAGCGKTAEFEARTVILQQAGRFAVFVRVEDLADDGLEACLSTEQAALLVAWKAGGERGYFFLDSVDEARLNRRRFDKALHRLARELDGALGRAHVYVSCRISDWRGREDFDTVSRLLKAPAPPKGEIEDPEGQLLDPVFKQERTRPAVAANDDVPQSLTVVRLPALNDAEHRALAQGRGVTDVDRFLSSIEQHGLGALTERPADLLELAEYWKSKGRFASLALMTEHAVAVKLSERQRDRADSGVLTAEKARHGAERLAAALTFGHSFTLRAAAQEADPALAASAIDPVVVLPDWTDEERGTLLRRPIFAPATYGRIRFHHRGTQDYLTACWLRRLRERGCPRQRIERLLLAERFGVATVVPALRPVAAWLALKDNDLCNAIIAREPMILIQHGDPGSLPMAARRAVLLRLAERHRDGDMYEDRVDDRAIWLFAHKDLSNEITAAWELNPREEFRGCLLRMIREGQIAACQPLWREVLEAGWASSWLAITALEAAVACSDNAALAELAELLMRVPGAIKESQAAHLATGLFPDHLDVAGLKTLIEGCVPLSKNAVGGFAERLSDLSVACHTPEQRLALIEVIADLALQKPHRSEHEPLSRRHWRLAEPLVPVVLGAMRTLAHGAAPDAVIRALLAIERCDHYHRHDELPDLSAAVNVAPAVKRRLLWASLDAAEAEIGERPSEFYHVRRHSLNWGCSEGDVAWLIDDVSTLSCPSDRMIALQLAAGVLRQADRLHEHQRELEAAISGDPALTAELTIWLSPPPLPAEELTWRRQDKERQAKHAREQEKAKQSWREFRAHLQADPSRISDADHLTHLHNHGFGDLIYLTRWLCGRTGTSAEEEAALHWRALAPVFGEAVADAYRAGLQRLWRVAPLKWPKHTSGNGITTYRSTELAYAGMCVEAAEDRDWAARLTSAEARRAAILGLRSEKSYARWLDDLLASHPKETLAELRRGLRTEWQDTGTRQQTVLHHLEHGGSVPAVATPAVIDRLLGIDTLNPHTAERGVRIIYRLSAEIDPKRLRRVARQRVTTAMALGEGRRVVAGLALLYLVDAQAAMAALKRWIGSAPASERKARAESTLAGLFGRDRALANGSLTAMEVPALGELCRLTYIEINALEDAQHEGSYEPGVRNNAESARNAILSALIERPGRSAFEILSAIGASGIAGIRPIRFRELVHHMAEQAAELPTWTPGEVRDLESRYLMPMKSGGDVIELVSETLDAIAYDLVHEDASARRAYQRAEDEAEVQEWLAADLKARLRDRCHVHREPQVAAKKKPDIVVSALSIASEVAIEIKHGNKRWTFRQLEHALTTQLAGRYLRPTSRRHGVLVITLHQARTWQAPEGGKRLSFEEVIARLQARAAELVSNATGEVTVRVVGLKLC